MHQHGHVACLYQSRKPSELEELIVQGVGQVNFIGDLNMIHKDLPFLHRRTRAVDDEKCVFRIYPLYFHQGLGYFTDVAGIIVTHAKAVVWIPAIFPEGHPDRLEEGNVLELRNRFAQVPVAKLLAQSGVGDRIDREEVRPSGEVAALVEMVKRPGYGLRAVAASGNNADGTVIENRIEKMVPTRAMPFPGGAIHCRINILNNTLSFSAQAGGK